MFTKLINMNKASAHCSFLFENVKGIKINFHLMTSLGIILAPYSRVESAEGL